MVGGRTGHFKGQPIAPQGDLWLQPQGKVRLVFKFQREGLKSLNIYRFATRSTDMQDRVKARLRESHLAAGSEFTQPRAHLFVQL